MAAQPNQQPSSPSTYRHTLQGLIPELMLQVFESLPDQWSVIALRLTCHQLNNLYLAHETRIRQSLIEHLVAPFRDYYTFLTTLYLPEAALKHPPKGGWPNITRETCSGFGKTDMVIDVLRHLPYIEEHRNLHSVDFNCDVLDYSTATGEDFSGSDLKSGETCHAFNGPVSRHRVVIFEGYESGGLDMMLDTMTGVVYEEFIRMDSGKVLPVERYLREKKQEYAGLQALFVPECDGCVVRLGEEQEEGEHRLGFEELESRGAPSSPGTFFGSQEDGRWVRHLYHKFGWPDKDWRKEEAMEAVRAFAQMRDSEYHTQLPSSGQTRSISAPPNFLLQNFYFQLLLGILFSALLCFALVEGVEVLRILSGTGHGSSYI